MSEAAERLTVADDRGKGGLQLLITAGPARFVADQPLASGGLDLGPTPHELVSAGLAACVSQTVRLYANRKAWPLAAVHVEVAHGKDTGVAPVDRLRVSVSLSGDLSSEQTERLMQIAANCPVHRMLAAGARIETVQA